MAMNNTILLAKEIMIYVPRMRSSFKRGKKSKRQVETIEGFSIQEDQEFIQQRNQAEEAIQVVDAGQRPQRATPRCSDCHIIGHKRLQCPQRKHR
jgi:hypothetical protein